MDRPYRNIFIVCAVITVGAGVLRSPDVDEDLRELLGALVLLPLGFFLGGVFIYGGDPGIGVILVPPESCAGVRPSRKPRGGWPRRTGPSPRHPR